MHSHTHIHTHTYTYGTYTHTYTYKHTHTHTHTLHVQIHSHTRKQTNIRKQIPQHTHTYIHTHTHTQLSDEAVYMRNIDDSAPLPHEQEDFFRSPEAKASSSRQPHASLAELSPLTSAPRSEAPFTAQDATSDAASAEEVVDETVVVPSAMEQLQIEVLPQATDQLTRELGGLTVAEAAKQAKDSGVVSR
jgi:hypothetical protein